MKNIIELLSQQNELFVHPRTEKKMGKISKPRTRSDTAKRQADQKRRAEEWLKKRNNERGPIKVFWKGTFVAPIKVFWKGTFVAYRFFDKLVWLPKEDLPEGINSAKLKELEYEKF